MEELEELLKKPETFKEKMFEKTWTIVNCWFLFCKRFVTIVLYLMYGGFGK